MRDSLGPFLDRLEVFPPLFAGDEVARWRPGTLDHLVSAGLLRQADNAAAVACACGDDHVEPVQLALAVPGTEVRAFIRCPHNGRVRVSLSRISQWIAAFDALARGLAQSLGTAGEPEEVVPDRIWFLGTATLGGRPRRLFLARGLWRFDAASMLGNCAPMRPAADVVVLVPGMMPLEDVWAGDPKPTLSLKPVLGLERGELLLTREHLDAALIAPGTRIPPASVRSFPVPAGTEWRGVKIVVEDGRMCIEAGGRRQRRTFQEAGFEDRRRTNVPDRLWAMLKVFAMHGGALPADSDRLDVKTRTNIKQHVADLRRRLRNLLPGIDGDPVVFDDKQRSYITAFLLSAVDGARFPTPAGTNWPDVTIARVGETVIEVSVPADDRTAVCAFDEDGEPGWETAQREGLLVRRYELRTLGLADDTGKPNPRGAALLEVLAGRGSVKRKATDKAMLGLGSVLTKMMGIEGSSFDFAPFKESWAARFEVVNVPQPQSQTRGLTGRQVGV